MIQFLEIDILSSPNYGASDTSTKLILVGFLQYRTQRPKWWGNAALTHFNKNSDGLEQGGGEMAKYDSFVSANRFLGVDNREWVEFCQLKETHGFGLTLRQSIPY